MHYYIGGYTNYGGLRAIAYTDIVQVTMLILGGLAVTTVGLVKVGAATPGCGGTVVAASPEKFHMIRPLNNPDVPWLGVFFGGLWMANVFYWGCNQFITQRTLAAKNVWHGQMGVVFAGFLKLLVPVLVVLPGIIAFCLYCPDSGLLRSSASLRRRSGISDPGETAASRRNRWFGHSRSDWSGDAAHRVDVGIGFLDPGVRDSQTPVPIANVELHENMELACPPSIPTAVFSRPPYHGRHAFRRTEKGYNLELRMALPGATMRAVNHDGHPIGFDIAINDNDAGTGPLKQQLHWSGANDMFWRNCQFFRHSDLCR